MEAGGGCAQQAFRSESGTLCRHTRRRGAAGLSSYTGRRRSSLPPPARSRPLPGRAPRASQPREARRPPALRGGAPHALPRRSHRPGRGRPTNKLSALRLASSTRRLSHPLGSRQGAREGRGAAGKAAAVRRLQGKAARKAAGKGSASHRPPGRSGERAGPARARCKVPDRTRGKGSFFF